MYKPLVKQMDEDIFSNINFSKNIECIIPTAELLINFRSNGLRAKKPCYVYAEKMDFKGLIQLRITEKLDQRHMYITTVDGASFQELKQEQSLHVTFSGFIDNLVRILQDCQAGKLEINLVQANESFNVTNCSGNMNSNGDFQLQFVEMRSFKNLVHLCLPCHLAPLSVVLFYMNNILDSMQKKIASQDGARQQLDHELNSRINRIEQLDTENAQLREKLIESTRSLNQRHTDEVQQLQESLRKAAEQRHNDNERNRKALAALQTQMDKVNAENSKLQMDKNQEVNRNDRLNEDLNTLKSQVNSFKEQNEKLRNEISALKNLDRKNEMHLSDARKQINELQEKIKKYDKSKADIVAELEAEKKISHTKRHALEMATEEISKANGIIVKQSQEITKLKKTVSWRTEVAIQQEKAINQKEDLLNLRDKEVLFMRKTIESLREEIPQQLESMRVFANSLEVKYKEQIQILKDKLQSHGKENYSAPIVTQVTSRRK